jgi:hypothetical protein
MIMKTVTSILAVSCMLSILAGCATSSPAGTGTTVRAIMASQIIDPEGTPGLPGSDAGTAVLAYKNYQGSFATPAPQVESTLFGANK